MCYFGVALIHRLHAVDKPTGVGMAGSSAYIYVLMNDPLALLHRHAVTPHASSTHPQLLHASLWNYEIAVSRTRLVFEGSPVSDELDAWYVLVGGRVWCEYQSKLGCDVELGWVNLWSE